MKSLKQGFTLIEILVVMAIIGLLSALALTGMGGARKGARDTQRKSDLNQYKLGLEAYSGDYNGLYCTTDSNSYTNTGIFGSDAVSVLVPEYMSAQIDDPVNDGGIAVTNYHYRYYVDGTRTIYKLIAKLENGAYWEVCSNGKAGKVSATSWNYICNVL